MAAEKIVLVLALAQIAMCATVPEKYRSCRYFCGGSDGTTYCCDDGSLPMPPSHSPHPGTCPTPTEQLCKGPEDNEVFLKTKSAKLHGTASGSLELSREGGSPVLCASDGYCLEDERCCMSACAKRHVCLKALFPRKKGD